MRAAVLALLMLGACAQTPVNDAPPTQSATHFLAGTKWLRVDDTNANPHGATMDFEGNRASGYTGCNRWTADVTENGEQLRFGMVAVTEMACASPIFSTRC